MKQICIVLIALLIGFGSAYGAKTPNVVVFPIKGIGVSEHTADLTTDRLRALLGRSGKVRILERNEIDKILTTIGANLDDCSEEGCGIQIGRHLDADKIISGTITRVGRRTTIAVNFIDVETTERQIPASRDLDNVPEERLIDYIPDLMDQIISRIPTEGKILEVDGNKILVDIGSKNNLKVGAELKVELIKEIADPETGEMRSVPQQVGKLKVTGFAGTEFANCKPSDGSGFAVGMKVSTIQLAYEQKVQAGADSRAIAGSFMFPGFGQIRTDQGRGWVYLVGFLGSAAFGGLQAIEYMDASDNYDEAYSDYIEKGKPEDYEQLVTYKDKKSDAQTGALIGASAAGGFYLIGILDAFIFGGGETGNDFATVTTPSTRWQLVAVPGGLGLQVKF